MWFLQKFSMTLSPVYVAFVAVFLLFSDVSHGFAEESALDGLFSQLRDEKVSDFETIEQDIWAEWRKSGSRSVDFLLQRGMSAMNEGRLRLAIKHFTTVTEQAPEFAEGYNMRATAYFMMQEFGLSVADIETTLQLEPRHFGAMSGLGMILEQTGRPKQALSIYQKVLEVHPKSPQAQAAQKRLEAELQGTSL